MTKADEYRGKYPALSIAADDIGRSMQEEGETLAGPEWVELIPQIAYLLLVLVENCSGPDPADVAAWPKGGVPLFRYWRMYRWARYAGLRPPVADRAVRLARLPGFLTPYRARVMLDEAESLRISGILREPPNELGGFWH